MVVRHDRWSAVTTICQQVSPGWSPSSSVTSPLTRDIYLSVMPQVAQAAAEATAAIVPRATKSPDIHDSVDTLCAPGDKPDTEDDLKTGKTPGHP